MTTTIIASDAEVRAWRDGATSFRRPVKPQPTSVERWKHGYVTPDTDVRYATLRDATGKGWANCGPFRCPWKPGDVLHVRECWSPLPTVEHGDDMWAPMSYRADGNALHDGAHWRSAATMPAWASRMSVRVTGVGIAKVSELTEEDAKAMGGADYKGPIGNMRAYLAAPYRYAAQCAFEDRYGATAMDGWAWVVNFERVEVV